METLLYEETDGVAVVTLNRPDKYNAFDSAMMRELSGLWQALKTNDGVRCIVLTGAGEKAFCTGIDRSEIPTDGGRFDPLTFEDPGRKLGPKTNELYKPVIAAVNGMACGGAFYMLGEVEFIIAGASATFFDPHVTYGMVAVYEPLLMMRRMPWGEIARLTLAGNHERVSAKRAYEIGLVSAPVPCRGRRILGGRRLQPGAFVTSLRRTRSRSCPRRRMADHRDEPGSRTRSRDGLRRLHACPLTDARLDTLPGREGALSFFERLG